MQRIETEVFLVLCDCVQVYSRADLQCGGKCGPVSALCSLVQEVSGHEGAKRWPPGSARNRFPPSC